MIHFIDWTPADFIQHSANLDYYERKLSGMVKLGEDISDKIRFAMTQSMVLKLRKERQDYFNHHQITAIL